MKSVTMATKREMSNYTVFFSVLGHKKFIHKILAKSESVHFQPLFNFFGALRELLLIACLHNLSSCSNNMIKLIQQLNTSSDQLKMSFG